MGGEDGIIRALSSALARICQGRSARSSGNCALKRFGTGRGANDRRTIPFAIRRVTDGHLVDRLRSFGELLLHLIEHLAAFAELGLDSREQVPDLAGALLDRKRPEAHLQ